MNKLIPTKDRPLNCSTRGATCSVSRRQYEGALKRMRAQAKREKRLLITNEGQEDYRSYDGPVEDEVSETADVETSRMAVFKPISHNVKFVRLQSGVVINVDNIARLLPGVPLGVPGTLTQNANYIEFKNGSTQSVSEKEMENLIERLDPKDV